MKSEFTPVEQTYSQQEIDKLYCAEFQSYHRLSNTSATAVQDICERHVYASDGSRVCEYDPKGELCVIKEAFMYLDTPDPCSVFGNAQAGNMTFNATAESFCNANPFCIYGEVYSTTGTSADQREQNMRNKECRDYQRYGAPHTAPSYHRLPHSLEGNPELIPDLVPHSCTINRYKWLFYADGTYPQGKTNLCTAWMYKTDQVQHGHSVPPLSTSVASMSPPVYAVTAADSIYFSPHVFVSPSSL